MRMRTEDGREFIAARYGVGRWQQKTTRGRLPYAVHVWSGTLGKETVYLHFTEIPGTSGPNWGSGRSLKAYRAKVAWQDKSNFQLDEAFRIYAGPLAGDWTVTCAAP